VRSNECVCECVWERERAHQFTSNFYCTFFLEASEKGKLAICIQHIQAMKRGIWTKSFCYRFRDFAIKSGCHAWLKIRKECLADVCVCVLERWGAAEKQSEKRQSKFLTKSNRRFLRLVLKRNPPTSSSSFSPTRDLARKRFQMNKKRTSQNNDDWVKESSLFRRAGEGGSFWRGERVERMKES
jgi:hypothetical protein